MGPGVSWGSSLHFAQTLCKLFTIVHFKRSSPSIISRSGLEKTDQGSSLYVSLVKQKAVFRVDEKGTEAAAVTMAVLDKCAAVMGPQPRELYFDRPFVYMILDMETRVPLFVGILDDPD